LSPPPAEPSSPPPPPVEVDDDNGDLSDLVSPSPYPPPPPPRYTSPPPPDVLLPGSVESGLLINETGDPYTDAQNQAIIDALLVMDTFWYPIGISLTVFGLWFIHNSVVNLPGNTRLISPGWRHGLNVFATGSAYLICAFCNLAFNHLVLTAISLPAFVACVQMGATCVALLLINGTFGALYHSRTSNLFKGMLAGFIAGCFSWVPADYRTSLAQPPTPAAHEMTVERKADEATKARRDSCINPDATCGLAICGTRQWQGIMVGSRADLWKWMPAAMLHAATNVLLLHALNKSTVTAVVVWRQLTPLPTMMAENFLSNAVYRSSFPIYFGLMVAAMGVVIYAANDLLFDWLGTTFAVLSMLTLVWEGLLKRHILTDSKEPLVLSLQAMIFLNNLVGFVGAALLMLSYELWLFGYGEIPHIGIHEVAYLLCSAFLTGLYHYMGLQLARAVSAAYVLTCTNAAKIGIVAFSGALFGDTVCSVTIFALICAIGGNMIYMYARLNVMQAQELAETKIVERGDDVNKTIVAKPDKPPEPEPQSADAWTTTTELVNSARSTLPEWLGGLPPKQADEEAEAAAGSGGGAPSSSDWAPPNADPLYDGYAPTYERQQPSAAVLLGLAVPPPGVDPVHTTEEGVPTERDPESSGRPPLPPRMPSAIFSSPPSPPPRGHRSSRDE